MLLHNNGFVLIGGCGEELEEGQTVHFSPGADDKVFRLDEQADAVCRAEEQKAVPIPAGIPLRERFKEDEPFCFGRDYDAAHLASNPKQLVTQIRVGRLAPDQEKEPDSGGGTSWWFNVKLDVSVTLRSGPQPATARYSCSRGSKLGVPSPRRGRNARRPAASAVSISSAAASNDIMLSNRHSGLPLDKRMRQRRTPANNSRRGRSTRSDDRLFRLTRMPVEACR